MNGADPLVSVIVPCFNHGIYLGECLESILIQTYQNWECIIIDNGSTDNTKQVSESYIQKDKRFKYIYNSVKGVSLARNTGIKNSVGKYILPVDADDKIAPPYISEAVAVLEKRENVKLVYCNAKLFGSVNRDWVLPDYSLKNMLIENIIFCSAVFRRKDFDASNGYNEQMVEGFEDWDFWLDILKDKGEVFKLPQTYFFYRIKENSRNHTLDIEKQKKLRAQVYQNHKDLYAKVTENADFVYEFYDLQNKYNVLKNSRDLQAGKNVLTPIRFIKRLFGK
ncbi:MAG TPA: glycosyltransferase family A protein [Bacteroidia bacterium]|nr:glycosyltransferase family A protein [Bacteroidia bacterium]